MKLNEQQKRAVEYLGGPLLVLAGPGTGKTQLLSKKVEYILKNTDTNPENILCMTFTESGARNMRERLKTVIGADGRKVKIGTYHAIGTDILTTYTNYAPEYPRRLDGAIDEVRRFKIVKEIMAGLPGNDILRKDNAGDVASVISEAKGAGLTSDELLIIAEKNIADSAVISDAVTPLLRNVVPRKLGESLENAYQPIDELLSKYIEGSEPILRRIERTIVGLARELHEAISEAMETEKLKPLSSWKDKFFEKDGTGGYRLKDRVANLKLKSVAQVMKVYNERLAREGLYDFDDMVQEAAKVLREDTGFRATMQEKYQFIMLDEFQDTNPAQFAIIKALTDYEKPLVMAVGDDDQAIYEFQGALSTNMVDFQKHYDAEVITLTENYRSTQEILDFSHEIINQATDRFEDKKLTAHRDGVGAEFEQVFKSRTSAGNKSSADGEVETTQSQIRRYEFLASDMEYAFVADKIAELVAAGVKQNEIAVISYKTKYFLPLLPFLKARPEIKIAYEKQDNLLEDEQIHQIITIARYVYELANEKRVDTSILEILTYPFWQLPVLEVVKSTGQARHEKRSVFEVLSASKIAEITDVMRFLAELTAKSLTEPFEIWLDLLIGGTELDGFRSPFLEYYTRQGEYEAFSLYEKLATLRARIKSHCGEQKVRVKDFVAMIDDFEEAEMPIAITSPYREGMEAVQILSAHKAKGLEFKYVFIIAADHRAWGAGKGNNSMLSLPKNLLQIRHTGMTDGERLRILYVALTRAKEGLIITNSLKDFSGKTSERLEYLNEYDENDAVVSPFVPGEKIETMYKAAAPAKVAKNLKTWLTPLAKLTPEMRELYSERVANWRMSASSLTSFIDIAYAGPQEFFKNYILRASSECETEELALGNLIHATFEAVTVKGLTDAEAVEFFLAELEKKDLTTETTQALRERGPVILATALTRFGEIIRNGRAEVNLAPEKLVVGEDPKNGIPGVPVTGKIDHIVIDEKAKTLMIFDYKTGGYHKDKWRSHATLYKYMLQLGFYRLLLKNSQEFRKYKIEKAAILFVVPDNDGEVHMREYEFNEADEEELIVLMRSVYTWVTSLMFIDDPRIFIAPDKNRGLKDINGFIELLLAQKSYE